MTTPIDGPDAGCLDTGRRRAARATSRSRIPVAASSGSRREEVHLHGDVEGWRTAASPFSRSTAPSARDVSVRHEWDREAAR